MARMPFDLLCNIMYDIVRRGKTKLNYVKKRTIQQNKALYYLLMSILIRVLIEKDACQWLLERLRSRHKRIEPDSVLITELWRFITTERLIQSGRMRTDFVTRSKATYFFDVSYFFIVRPFVDSLGIQRLAGFPNHLSNPMQHDLRDNTWTNEAVVDNILFLISVSFPDVHMLGYSPNERYATQGWSKRLGLDPDATDVPMTLEDTLNTSHYALRVNMNLNMQDIKGEQTTRTHTQAFLVFHNNECLYVNGHLTPFDPETRNSHKLVAERYFRWASVKRNIKVVPFGLRQEMVTNCTQVALAAVIGVLMNGLDDMKDVLVFREQMVSQAKFGPRLLKMLKTLKIDSFKK